MKAIAVHPGKAGSIHLEDVPKPSVDEVADGRGVLVRVLRVGVDGTDKEINAAEYGAAPEGDDFLIIGHENFGVVEEVGPNVPDTIRPGGYVVASVRRPGSSIYGKIGLQDFTTDDVYFERGISDRAGHARAVDERHGDRAAPTSPACRPRPTSSPRTWRTTSTRWRTSWASRSAQRRRTSRRSEPARRR